MVVNGVSLYVRGGGVKLESAWRRGGAGRQKMKKDYSEGRYNVLNAQGEQIGRIDGDEFVRDPRNQLLWRIDGDEVYLPGSPPGGLKLSATIHNGKAETPDGELLFQIVPE